MTLDSWLLSSDGQEFIGKMTKKILSKQEMALRVTKIVEGILISDCMVHPLAIYENAGIYEFKLGEYTPQIVPKEHIPTTLVDCVKLGKHLYNNMLTCEDYLFISRDCSCGNTRYVVSQNEAICIHCGETVSRGRT